MKLEDILLEGHIEAYDYILSNIDKLYKEENAFHPVFALFLKSKTDDPTPAFTFLNLPDDFVPMLNSQEGKNILDKFFKYQIDSIIETDDEFEPYGFLMITEVWKTKLPEDVDMEEFMKLSDEERYDLAQERGVKTESIYIVLNTKEGDMTADYDVIRDGDAFVRSEEPQITFFEKGKGDLNMNKFKYF